MQGTRELKTKKGEGRKSTVDRKRREVSEGAGTMAWARFGKHCKETEQPGQRPGGGHVGGTFKSGIK